MRKVQKNIIKTILIAFSVGIFASSVYAGVAFVGDFRQSSFASVKKLLPTIFTCPDGQGWYQGKCVNKCDRSSYPFTDTPDETKGTYTSCTDMWGTYYTYIECHNGWDLIEGNCVETDCTGFNYTSEPTSVAGETESCKSGKDTFFKYTECHDGWDFNEENGMCSVHTCNSTTYPYNTDPGDDAGTVIRCKTGVAFQYGYSDCRTGWDKSNGYCNVHTCDSNTFPFSSQPSNTIGTVISCPTGNNAKYGYSACVTGYVFNNGACDACDFTGYGQSSSVIANCTSSSNKTCGGMTKHKCTTCANGYGVVSKTGACEAITCPVNQVNQYLYWCDHEWVDVPAIGG